MPAAAGDDTDVGVELAGSKRERERVGIDRRERGAGFRICVCEGSGSGSVSVSLSSCQVSLRVGVELAGRQRESVCQGLRADPVKSL